LTTKNPIETIIERAGGVRPAARQIGVSPSSIVKWSKTKLVPSRHQARVVELGLATPDELIGGGSE